MAGEKDLAGDLPFDGESSRTKTSNVRLSQLNPETLDEKMSFFQNGIDFLSFENRAGRPGNELTLSYLCENSKLNEFSGRNEFPGKIAGNPCQKGKELAVSENTSQDEKWIERDFLNLNERRPSSSKRKLEDDDELEEKKTKMETLNLSLALPGVSDSLTASNAVKKPKPTTSERTQTTAYSNDFTAAPSLSYSYSLPFSHNPSCSLTRNSTGNFDYSQSHDKIWCAGEGTNGSVHSRFRPVGDSVALSNNPSLYKPSGSENCSFFPSELPAGPAIEIAESADPRKRESEKLLNLDGSDIVRSERILFEIVSESIPTMALMIQEMPDETLDSVKAHLRNLIESPENKFKLANLQNRLEKRSDLTKESLSKCATDQLNILVAIKTGLKYFLSGKLRIPVNELIEIFLLMRCRNVNCSYKSLLPVDDCECKICSNNKGFCSSCMCPVCKKFDSASNTCSWVGCDVCSHWCHAACGLQKNLIKPGPSLKGPRGSTEMLFHCIGCGHRSEMFGFVKDVFVYCAKNWGFETLVKELDCVRKIFRGSDDAKGRELFVKADEMVNKLETKRVSPSDACNFIIQFFNYADSITEFPSSALTSKDLTTTETSYRKDEASVTPSTSVPKFNIYAPSSSFGSKDAKSSVLSDLEFDSIESMVRIKEAESRMFQKKADEARTDAESFKRMIQTKAENMEEEYREKLSRLCLQETEERRRRKLEEMKVLENSQCDYKNMKMRMEAEIAGLLKRMEVTRQQWV